MAKSPKVIKNIQKDKRQGLQEGGEVLPYASTPPEQKTTVETAEQPAVTPITPQTGEFLDTQPVQLGAAPTMTVAQADVC